MVFKNLKQRVMGFLNHVPDDAVRRPDGGTSYYRPIGRRKQDQEKSQQEARQDPAYIHTGFTGMNPPADPYGYSVQETYGQGTYGQSGFGQMPNYGQSGFGQPANYNQSGFGQPASYGQPAYGAGSYAVPYDNRPEAFGGVSASFSQPVYEPTAPRPEKGWFGGRSERNVQSQGNISYMPGYAPDAGAAPFNHVEHILTMTGLRSCYEAIECMKNGETLIVTLDVLGSEGESIRCQDMLAGAAFTLQCTVRNLASVGVVVIAPAGVKILPEQTGSAYAAPDPYAAPVQPYPAEEYPPRRERRASRNAVGWENAAQGGSQGFNPYTGSMPAAAGNYGAYGGY